MARAKQRAPKTQPRRLADRLEAAKAIPSYGVANKLTSMVLDGSNPSSVSARSRGRRWNELLKRFPDIESMRILDLGGRPQFWRDAPVKPAAVTTVNLI